MDDGPKEITVACPEAVVSGKLIVFCKIYLQDLLNLNHSLGKFSRRQIDVFLLLFFVVVFFSSYFPRK